MIDIFNIQATDQEDDLLDMEIDSCQSTQDSPNNVAQSISMGVSQSNLFFQDSSEQDKINYQKEMDQIEEQIQKEIEKNDFTNLTKKERYKIIRKIKNKYSSRKSRLKKMLVKDNLESINQDLKKQVASLKVQVQNLDKQNQFLLESIYGLSQMINSDNVQSAKVEVQKYRVERQGNQFILSKNFLLVVALFLLVTTNIGNNLDSTKYIKMAGFDHKYFVKINKDLQIQNILIDKPVMLKKFKRINKSVFMKNIENQRKIKRLKINSQFNYQRILIFQMKKILEGFFPAQYNNDSFSNVQESRYKNDDELLVNIKIEESNLLEQKVPLEEEILAEQFQSKIYSKQQKMDVIELLTTASRINLDIRNNEMDKLNQQYRKIMYVLNDLLECLAKEKISMQDKENINMNKSHFTAEDYDKLEKILKDIITNNNYKTFEHNFSDLKKYANIYRISAKRLKKRFENSSVTNGSFLKDKDKLKKSVSVKKMANSRSPLTKSVRVNKNIVNTPKSQLTYHISPIKKSLILSKNLSKSSQKADFLNHDQKKILNSKKIVFKALVQKIFNKFKTKKNILLLERHQIDDNCLNYVLKNQKQFYTYKKINLAHNQITNDGFAILFHYIIKNQEKEDFQIQRIFLKNNKMTRRANMILKKILEYYKGPTIEVIVDSKITMASTTQSRLSQISDFSGMEQNKVYFMDQLKISKLKLENQKNLKDQRKKLQRLL